MKLWRSGLVYLEWLFRKFGFDAINFFSHKILLAALRLLLELNLGSGTSKMYDQLLVSVKAIGSSKILAPRLPLNLFSN